MSMKTFQNGDFIRFIGPERSIYTSPADHPSFYINHRIISVKPIHWTNPNAVFAHVESFLKSDPTRRCGSWQWLHFDRWDIRPVVLGLKK